MRTLDIFCVRFASCFLCSGTHTREVTSTRSHSGPSVHGVRTHDRTPETNTVYTRARPGGDLIP
eukprot:6560479-Prymnesium_polylepis.1